MVNEGMSRCLWHVRFALQHVIAGNILSMLYSHMGPNEWQWDRTLLRFDGLVIDIRRAEQDETLEMMVGNASGSCEPCDNTGIKIKC